MAISAIGTIRFTFVFLGLQPNAVDNRTVIKDNPVSKIVFLTPMNIGMVCFPTYGGSGVVATELGIALANKGHKVHFMSYSQPFRLNLFNENLFYHEFNVNDYPLFEYQPYESVLA